MKKTNKQHHGTGLCCSRVLRFPWNIFFSLDDKELEVFAQNTWNLRIQGSELSGTLLLLLEQKRLVVGL